MLRLNSITNNRRGGLTISLGAFTIKEATMPMDVSQTLSSGYAWTTRNFTGTFSTNDFSATYSQPSFTLPAGNYIIVMNYSFNANITLNAGLGLQTGTSSSPSVNYNLLNSWEYGQMHQGSTQTIGAAFTANTTVQVWQTSGNVATLSTGNIRVFKLERTGAPSGNQATGTFASSVVSGWQVLKLSTSNLSSISGLTHNATTGEWSIPAGMYLITFYGYSPTTISGVGFQSSSTSVTPSSVTNPTELDTWQYNAGGNSLGMNISFWYTFNSANAFRVYGYFGASGSMATNRIFITRY